MYHNLNELMQSCREKVHLILMRHFYGVHKERQVVCNISPVVSAAAEETFFTILK